MSDEAPHCLVISDGRAALPPKAQLKLAKFSVPDCDIAVGCGRQAVAPLLDLKRRRPDVMTIYIQDPGRLTVSRKIG